MTLLQRFSNHSPVAVERYEIHALKNLLPMSTYKIIRNEEWKTIQAEKAALAKDLEASQTFIESLKTGNLQAAYSGDPETLIGQSMMSLRDRMIDLAREEERRNWINQGIAQFADILRVSDQHSSSALYDSVISNLVRYLKANQGGIFSLNDDDDNDMFLELITCYAYDRKKFQQKRVPLGEGLIGQCFYEKQVVYLKDVPKEYVTISSGLGEARPRNVILVPMILDQDIHGVIELASFSLFEQYQIDFLQKVAESIAATLSASRVSNRTQRLLQESMSQSEQLKAQEEEMRQSMEELTATQEEMERKSRELSQTAAEMNSILNGINATMATIEFTTEGMIVTANKNFLDTMKYSLPQIQGKHHRMFVPEDIRNSDDYKTFWTALANGQSHVNVFKRIDSSGEEVWLNAIYNPILDQDGKVQRVIKLANNVTAEKEKEKKVHELLEETRANEEELRQNMEELSSTQEHLELRSQEINAAAAEMRSILNGIDATMATIEFTPDGTITAANERFLTLMKCTLADIKGKHHRLFVPKDVAESDDYKTFWPSLAAGNAVNDVFPRITLNGEVVWLNAIYNPIFNDMGQVTKVLKLANDITASKRQEEEIRGLLEESRAQEEELRQNMEEVTATQDEIQRQNNLISESTAEMRSIMTGINATMASIEFSPDGTILHANENFLNAMGYSLAEIVGQHHRMFMPAGQADATAYRQFWKELASGNARVDTFERVTKKKESILLNAIYNPILNASGEVVKVVKLATHVKADSKR